MNVQEWIAKLDISLWTIGNFSLGLAAPPVIAAFEGLVNTSLDFGGSDER